VEHGSDDQKTVAAAGEGEAPVADVLALLHEALTTLYLTNPEAMTYVDASVTVYCGALISRGAPS
jgi:hypothetical protein